MEARLVDRDTVVFERLVHFHARGDALPRAVIDHDDVAREQLGHPRRVVIDNEFLQLDRKRQVLNQRTLRLIQNGRRDMLPFRHPRIATEGRIGRRQPVLGRDVVDDRTRRDRRFAEQPHLKFDRQVAVHQAADANHDDGHVREDVADLGQRAAFRRHERGAFRFAHHVAVAELARERGQALRRFRARAADLVLGLVVERAQAALADLILPTLHVRDHLRRVANDAQRDRDDQEAEDEHEPPRAIHREKAGRAEDIGPERAELIDVVGVGIVLREYRPHDAGDGEHDEQCDREAHRTE